MIKFSDFERAYEGQPLGKLDEGAISGLKNFLGRLFGGKVSKLDDIIKKYRTHEGEYWQEWSDATFQYNEASATKSMAKSAIVRGKQDEIMQRVKRTTDTLETARGEYKQALEKQANALVGSNERLKDYYESKKAEADAAIAQESYEEAKKLSDPKVIDAVYQNLESSLAKVMEQDKMFQEKYGPAYRDNYFGLSDTEMGHGSSHLGSRDLSGTHEGSPTIDTYLHMDDRVFATMVKKMEPTKITDLEQEFKEKLEEIKEKINDLHSEAQSKLDGLAKDKKHSEWKQHQDHTSIHDHDLTQRRNQIARKLGILMSHSTSK